MIRLAIVACLITTAIACCLDAAGVHTKLKAGDYAVGAEEVTFAEAQEKCKKINGQLAIIDSIEKYNATTSCIKEQLRAYSYTDQHVWTGGDQINGVWKWSNGEIITQFICKEFLTHKSTVGNAAAVFMAENDGTFCLYFDLGKRHPMKYICEHKRTGKP